LKIKNSKTENFIFLLFILCSFIEFFVILADSKETSFLYARFDVTLRFAFALAFVSFIVSFFAFPSMLPFYFLSKKNKDMHLMFPKSNAEYEAHLRQANVSASVYGDLT